MSRRKGVERYGDRGGEGMQGMTRRQTAAAGTFTLLSSWVLRRFSRHQTADDTQIVFKATKATQLTTQNPGDLTGKSKSLSTEQHHLTVA